MGFRVLAPYVSEASARLVSVDSSEEEMRRLASLLLTLAATKESYVPWAPFPGCVCVCVCVCEREREREREEKREREYVCI